MEIPKLNFDDFYKFIMSAGIILFLVGVLSVSFYLIYLKNWNIWIWFSFLVYLFMPIVAIFMMAWAGGKWYRNQQVYDRKLRAEAVIQENLAKSNVEEINKKIEKEVKKEKETKDDRKLQIEENIKKIYSDKQAQIKSFYATQDDRKLIKYFRSAEEGVLTKIQSFYPGLQRHVSFQNKSFKIHLDAIKYSSETTFLFEIKIYRKRMSPKTLKEILDKFNWTIERYKEVMVPKAVIGIIVISSDFERVEKGYKEYLQKKFNEIFPNYENGMILMLVDLNDIVF